MRTNDYTSTFYVDPSEGLRTENEALEQLICGCVTTGMRCLDVGCGPGVWSCVMSRLGAHVTGIDSKEERLSHARTISPESVFRLCGECPWPFETGAFAFILASWVLQELTSDDVLTSVVGELRRCIHPQGRLLVAENVYPDGRKLLRHSHLGDIFENRDDPPSLRFFRQNSVTPALAPRGFKEDLYHVVGVSFFQRFSCTQLC